MLICRDQVKAKLATLKIQSCLEYTPHRADVEISSRLSFDNLFTSQVDMNIAQLGVSREGLLAEALCSMASVRDSITGFPALREAADDLVKLLRTLKCQINDNNRLEPELVEPLRLMLVRLPNQFIPALNAHPATMLLMAHMHATVLFIDPMKASSCAGFYSLHAAPIQAFYEEISMRADIESRSSEMNWGYIQALPMMEIPIKVVRAFQWTLNQGQQATDTTPTSHPLLRSNTLSGPQRMSMLQILEDFPVGLWQNFMCR